ncbi:hypothetical protein RB1301 [Rhodopirellula baltica SH 1]|uniref:Uncharacterized protein n=1 Tax=Rhodopirellula baltica (strain DSM 10527 / NCIMB 13988 / SH1) TaxID=243090 RepID=Q7UXI8_RHOBA|nr:hypothetical protein RB1301 [Rhodopirellula baltica SH 1]
MDGLDEKQLTQSFYGNVSNGFDMAIHKYGDHSTMIDEVARHFINVGVYRLHPIRIQFVCPYGGDCESRA